MKRIGILLFVLLLIIGFAASSQDFFLMPADFNLHKGDKLSLHLLSGNFFNKENELSYKASKATRFTLYEGQKKTDLSPVAASSNDTTLLNYTLQNSGLIILELTREDEAESERNKFLKYLENAGLDKMIEEAKKLNQQYFVEKYHYSLKTLLAVDKPAGKDWDKPINQQYEIVLLQNPYKASYGDDITAQVLFKGKPLKSAVVIQYVKTITGAVIPQKLSADDNGMVYFKLSREGVYMVSSVYMEASADKKADFETWSTTYTFAFTNQDDAPNTYRNFGFGDKH